MNILSIILYTAFVVLIICGIVAIHDIIFSSRMTKKDKNYIRNFSEAFDETGDLTLTLKKLQTIYGDKTKEYKAVTNALNYLENSIYGDFETAAKLIEEALYNKKIKETHQIAIDMSIKKMSRYSLTENINV